MSRSSRPARQRRRRIAPRLEQLEDRRVLAAVDFIPQAPIIAPDHAWATSAVPSDLDGDGDPDLVMSSMLDHRVGWYENIDGQGTFGSLRLISDQAKQTRMVRTADLDGDDDLDVISANYESDSVSWFENLDGQGNFGPQHVITQFAINATAVDTSDVDGDGDLDLISTSAGPYDSDVSWYRNDGSGNFGAQLIITSEVDRPYSAVFADVDGDGDPDAVSASLYDDKLAWYENTDGLGDFGPQKIISEAFSDPNEIIAADIDGDGDLDVVAGENDYLNDNNRVAWYANDGQGNFGDAQFVTDETIGVESLEAVDVDGDDDLDLVSASFRDDKFAWYENLDGQGQFGAQQVITAANGGTSAIAADLDADGDLDLALSSLFDHTIAWVKNDGDGTFSDPIVLSEFGLDGVEEVRAADIDGDGDLDAVSASVVDDTFAWYENLDGLGTFGPVRLIDSNAPGAIHLETVDLDGDGDRDVLGSSVADNTVAWYENIDGKGTFSQRNVISDVVLGTESSKAVDLDGDGDFDVVAAATNADDSAVFWFENMGDGQFGDANLIWDDAQSRDSFSGPRDMESTDVDDDGDLDLVVASVFDDTLSWFENTDGLGAFGPQQVISNSVLGLWGIDVDDIDHDGHPDILVLRIGFGDERSDDVISWHANPDGTGQFTAERVISMGAHVFPEDADTSDFDGDGDLDVVVASFVDGKFSWYENLDGRGDFGDEQIVDNDAPGASAVVAADIDGDGQSDLLTGAAIADRVAWYRNDSNQPVRGDFSGDGKVAIEDVDLLCSQIRSGDHPSEFDLTNDGRVDAQDLDEMIVEILDTTFGDSTLDGVFNSSDLVQVFRGGEYEDGVDGNSTWADGDWNCDGDFDTSDLVDAFTAGGYVAEARPSNNARLAAALDWMFRQEEDEDLATDR